MLLIPKIWIERRINDMDTGVSVLHKNIKAEQINLNLNQKKIQQRAAHVPFLSVSCRQQVHSLAQLLIIEIINCKWQFAIIAYLGS